MLTFEMLVLPDAPHHALLIRLAGEELRAFPVDDPRLPAGAAGSWLVNLSDVR
jgi:hypothetical protein